MKLILKSFAEITIKSRPVRRQFMRQLGKNIRTILRDLDPKVRVEGEWDNLELFTTLDDPAQLQELYARLRCTPGISHFFQVLEYPLGDLDDIVLRCKEHYADLIDGHSLAVRCKRIGKHSFSSMDAERYVGSQLRQQCGASGIDLRKPDIEVRFEVRHQRLLIEYERHQGIGGYPLGTVEQSLVLMSGGFDSTVAAYKMMRRGLLTHFCFFNLGGRAHELGVKEVAYYLWNKYGSSHRVLFVSVPFEEVLGDILENVDNGHMGVVLKRMMLKAAEKIADDLDLDTLVTGEAVSQVASQTLTNLAVIDKATSKLVLRPLITEHKQDIISTAVEIGTAEFAENMPEYCGVISVNPKTRAKLGRVEHEESRLDADILQRAVERASRVTMDKVLDELGKDVHVEEVQEALSGQIVVDIRHPDQVEDQPLKLAGIEQLAVPFYAINSRFKEFDPNRQYLLYCDQGMMSKLHAHHLLHEGYANVRVYRPDPAQPSHASSHA